ncbi:mpv17-like protein isoform X2 [Engraulis encrasicolus]|uniref:mpv17-like protein isoform X2 n=1 Tax=Engraulis encrasicolus TaxID=184585 RepID=UPI002FD7899E
MIKVILKQVKRFPWITNVTLYGSLFAGGDVVHQWLSGKENMDWQHTRNVAVVAFTFHGNFNFVWMRLLERQFPGSSVRMVVRKLLLDQTLAAPLVTSVFYTGVSFLEGKDDIFQDWRQKFFNTYRFLNFALVPLYVRTAFTGCCAFVWAVFLCFSQQSGDGTAMAALAWMRRPAPASGTDISAPASGTDISAPASGTDISAPSAQDKK